MVEASRPGSRIDVAVIGGGLAGLTAATLLARAGRSVGVFEKSSAIGGRAVTQSKDQFHFNLGPHALYRRGHAAKVLRELGVTFTGGTPNASGGYAVDGGIKHTLPGGFVSLLTTGLLRLPAKFEVARLLGALQKIAAAPIQRIGVRQWLDEEIHHASVRRLVCALFRLATYADDAERMSAGAALAQLQMALDSNVSYLDGGWQVLVDGLRRAAERAGAMIASGTRVVAIEHDAAVRGVRLADGTHVSADAVIVAAGPADAQALVHDDAAMLMQQWAETAIPVKAACLDIALTRLPKPHASFALGIDRPLYLSVHSAVAKLAAPGGAMIHVAKYLNPNTPSDTKADERELEGLLDLIQPGWRTLVAERRFLPNMTVSHALITAAAGGTTGRPGPAVPNVRNLYVAGDWVGKEGMLADASAASACRAVEMVIQSGARRAAAAA